MGRAWWAGKWSPFTAWRCPPCNRIRGDDAHAAGVEALVPVAGPLVVHGVIMGTKVLPSVKDSTETSGPVRNSSMTILLPLFAEDPVRHHGADGVEAA